MMFDWLTPCYDPLMKWIMREGGMKRGLIESADVADGQRVLDLGCGTGTLTMMIARAVPGAAVTGLDGDPRVLEIARRKAADLDIQWDQGMADQLPYPDGQFDRAVSSLVVHHLDTATKQAAFAEVYRVLRPGGIFGVLDFAPPLSLIGRFQAAVVRRLEETGDNLAGRVPQFLAAAGFESVREVDRFRSPFGPLSILIADKPA